MRNLMQIAFKEIKIYLRQKQSFAFMVAFPIALMMVLGFALANAFSTEPSMGSIKLLYKNTVQSPELREGWQGFMSGLEERGVLWTERAPGIDGATEVSRNRFTAYLEVNDGGIRLYSRDTSSVEDNIVQGMLAAFADRYNLTAAAFGLSPETGMKIASGAMASGDFIKESSLNPDRAPGSMDYYAIVMSSMIAFYACMPSSQLIRGERLRHTDIRLVSSPLSKAELFAGKVLGSTVVNFLMVIIVVLFSKLVFQADWGSHTWPVLAVLFSEVLLAVSTGLGASYLIRGEGGQAAVLIFTQIASFLGGAYFPVSEMGNVFGWLTWISPLKWANDALFHIIYSDQTNAMILPIALNIGFAVLLLAISGLFMKRREGL